MTHELVGNRNGSRQHRQATGKRPGIVNVAARLSATAAAMPAAIAVIETGKYRQGKRQYQTVTFAELDADSDRLAAGLRHMGIHPGHRIVLMVRPSIDFISLTFALFKAGAVTVLIDPGMGRQHLLQCLEDVRPDGFVAISLVHAIRLLQRQRFPRARLNVTVGRRWFWGGPTLSQLRAGTALGKQAAVPFEITPTQADDSAAIIFTTGSTGPPKGVHYRHGNFDAQVDQIRDRYAIQPGGTDLSGFPLFALFNAAMGTATLIPDMDPTRPADVDPKNLIEAIRDWNVNQAFGSPALWNALGKYCEEHDVTLPTLRRVLSAGAPVPPHVLRWMRKIMAEDGDMFTPYGATEALPVASTSATEVLGETAARSARGAGTCVGRRFSEIEWRVIAISDEPISGETQATSLPPGEIGELIVRGPVVTQEYVTRTDANPLAKISAGDSFWHRMGDVGYLDDQDRFWFCGRKAHRVQTATGTMYTIPCEAIFNQHDAIYRSALVGVGPPGQQQPYMICEPWLGRFPTSDAERQQLRDELAELGQHSELTQCLGREQILLHESLPVDIRHNAKIFREKLSTWVESQRV